MAKDWAYTVRASQVIPVYPLREDLEPGDIFVVSTPIQRQQEEYKEKGFISLDQNIARLDSPNYEKFYRGSFGTAGKATPHDWRFTSGTNPQWEKAPLAFFPTYTFEVKSGGGFNLALPIQGIPVGLSFLKTEDATGSVVIADARTYGVSFEELRKTFYKWSRATENVVLFRQLQKANPKGVYIRLINRVFLAGRVVISLNASSRSGGNADVAAGKDVQLDATKGKGAVEDYKNTIKELGALSTELTEMLPGGSLKISHATRRSIVMSETFARPVVIGYHAFDFKVMNGELSEPMATKHHLETNDPSFSNLVGPDRLTQRINVLFEALKGVALESATEDEPVTGNAKAYQQALHINRDEKLTAILVKVASTVGEDFELSYRAVLGNAIDTKGDQFYSVVFDFCSTKRRKLLVIEALSKSWKNK